MTRSSVSILAPLAAACVLAGCSSPSPEGDRLRVFGSGNGTITYWAAGGSSSRTDDVTCTGTDTLAATCSQIIVEGSDFFGLVAEPAEGWVLDEIDGPCEEAGPAVQHDSRCVGANACCGDLLGYNVVTVRVRFVPAAGTDTDPDTDEPADVGTRQANLER